MEGKAREIAYRQRKTIRNLMKLSPMSLNVTHYIQR